MYIFLTIAYSATSPLVLLKSLQVSVVVFSLVVIVFEVTTVLVLSEVIRKRLQATLTALQLALP